MRLDDSDSAAKIILKVKKSWPLAYINTLQDSQKLKSKKVMLKNKPKKR